MPIGDPDLVYLDEEADARLQAWTRPLPGNDLLAIRNKATVALFLGAGVIVAEGQSAVVGDLHPEAFPPYLRVPAHGNRDMRTVHLHDFSLDALSAWLVRRRTLPVSTDRLLSTGAGGRPIAVTTLGRIVRATLETVNVFAPDMSPRTLRNTFGRQALLAGHDRDDLSRLLRLTSNRTVDRLAGTTPDGDAAE